MSNNFIEALDAEALEELFNKSKERPVVIFKHSATCPISARAYSQMTHFDGEVILVVVQKARELSTAIEKRTGVEHESPQVIVLCDAEVVWNASHFQVQAESVAEAVRNTRVSRQSD